MPNRLRHSRSMSFRVAPAVFDGAPGRNPQVTLMTEGFVPRSGGTGVPRAHVEFVPPKVRRSDPTARLKIFDVRNAVIGGDVYGGIVWAKETNRLVAAVRIDVLGQ